MVSPFEIAQDENASEGKYIYVPNGTANQYASPPPMATYQVTVRQGGTYILWGRVLTPTKKDNSFLIKIDNERSNRWHIKTGKDWHWDQVNTRGRGDPVHFILSEGKHTIQVMLSEDGTKLDKMLLTNHLVLVPTCKGESQENSGYSESD